MGEKPDLQIASSRHETGMLNLSQMYENLNHNHNYNYNDNLYHTPQESDFEEIKIINIHLQEDSEVRVVSRLNLSEIYDERSSSLLASHHFERTAVDSLAQ